MPRKTTKFIEPIPDTFENVAMCMVKKTEVSDDENDIPEVHDMTDKQLMA